VASQTFFFIKKIEFDSLSRKNAFGLIISPSDSDSIDQSSHGLVYLDNGEEIGKLSYFKISSFNHGIFEQEFFCVVL
jgi:hypothetical protein